MQQYCSCVATQSMHSENFESLGFVSDPMMLSPLTVRCSSYQEFRNRYWLTYKKNISYQEGAGDLWRLIHLFHHFGCHHCHIICLLLPLNHSRFLLERYPLISLYCTHVLTHLARLPPTSFNCNWSLLKKYRDRSVCVWERESAFFSATLPSFYEGVGGETLVGWAQCKFLFFFSSFICLLLVQKREQVRAEYWFYATLL